MGPPIIQEVSVSPTQLHSEKQRRPDRDEPKFRYSKKFEKGTDSLTTLEN
jgi:hypothetical protein